MFPWRRSHATALVALCPLLAACGGSDDGSTPGQPASGGSGGTGGSSGGGGGDAMVDTGPLSFTGDFTSGTTIPAHYKCPSSIGGTGTGDNVSPPLEWTGVPAEAQSLAVVLMDTRLSFVHWAIWDIPPTATGLPEGIADGYDVADPAGARQTGPSADSAAYFGPCSDPPAASTYGFFLHALDVSPLPVDPTTAPADIRAAIEAASIEMTSWEGTPE